MIIGHYMHGLWNPGGVATYLRRVTDAQRRLGHTVVLFDSAHNMDPSVEVVRDASELSAAARSGRVDVLHLHVDPPGGFSRTVPAVRTVHGHHPYCPSGSQYLTARAAPCERIPGPVRCGWGHLVDRCGSRRPDRLLGDFRRFYTERRSAEHVLLIAVSRFGRDRLVRAGYDAAQIRVIPNPGPLPEAVPPLDDGRPTCFLFMGRIVDIKGLAWLVEAMALTREPATLVVLGAGPDEARVRRLVVERGLQDRVCFEGWRQDSELPNFLYATRAVVVPSLWHEPAGLSAIEAAMYARPVVASSVGGLQEIVVPGTTGILVRPGDTAGLAAALDRLSRDPGLAAGMGASARERGLTRYSIHNHVARLPETYAEVA